MNVLDATSHDGTHIHAPNCLKTCNPESYDRSHFNEEHASLKNEFEVKFLCMNCDYSTNCQKFIEAHIATHTGLHHNEENNNLKLHIKRHSSDKKSYHCGLCDSDYISTKIANFKIHKRVHTGIKPYACKICDYKSTMPGQLKNHMRRHTGQKPYECEMCDFKCATTNTLKKHISTHTGEKPYECTFCNSRFSQIGNLKLHIERKHNEGELLKCDICDYKCSAVFDMKRHAKAHNEDKPFTCSMCDYTCKNKSNMKNHENSHMGEKPYACTKCNYKCTTSTHLMRHVLRLHKEENTITRIS